MNDPIENSEIINGEVVPCRLCGNHFQSKTLKLTAGAISMDLTSRICDACAEQEERDLAASKERNRLAEIRRLQEAREESWQKLCPVEFRTVTECGKTDIVRLERESPKLPRLLEYQYGPRGLIIRGKTRKCKTRSTWRLLRKLWLDKLSIAALTSAEFDRDCRDAAGNFNLSKWFERLAKVDVLFIDDLGKAQWTDATEAQWFDLVDRRTREHRPIIITTNEDGESLKSRMTPERAEALIARLREYCDSIVF